MSVFELRDRLVVFGHRGGRGPSWPAENTFPAFERAFREGADGIEIDVRLCATGEVVVFHDPDLKRMSGGADLRQVQRVSYIELANRFRAPVLHEVLSYCNDRRLGLNVEIKYDAVDPPRLVREVVRAMANFPTGDFIVSSFDPRILARVRALRARVRLAMLTTPERRWSLPLARALAARKLLFAVHLERTQTTGTEIRAIRARGVHVGVWTVNDPDEAARLHAWGTDWVISDVAGEILSRAARA